MPASSGCRFPWPAWTTWIPTDRVVRLIKVDVEGAELGVFRGASAVLGRCRPWVVFEHGAWCQVYGATTADVFGELARHRLSVWQLGDWLAGRPPLTRDGLEAAVATGSYWNFLAGPAPDRVT